MSDLDDAAMRRPLQQAAAYRELCRGVRRTGRENIFWALVLLAVAYTPGQPVGLVWLVISVLVGAELFVGLFKWFWPCAEGFLLDGLVLLLFVAWNLFVLYIQNQAFGRLNPVRIFFAAWMSYAAINRFKAYGQLVKVFAQRPTAAQIAWFDGLVREIRTADPQADDLALDLPTTPHWKAKLLGTTAFFVPRRGSSVVITGPDEFEILRQPDDHGTGSRRALLAIHHNTFPVFDIQDASWENYKKWRSAHPVDQEFSD
jgi:hypothetical protein